MSVIKSSVDTEVRTLTLKWFFFFFLQWVLPLCNGNTPSC